MSVHPCSRAYADALVEPFGAAKDKEVCLPATLLPLPSWKFVSRAVVIWATGPGGTGYVLIAPRLTYSSNITGSAPIHTTNNTYPSSPQTAMALTGTGIAKAFVNSPYNGAIAGGNTKVRLVTWGSKTICTTPGLNRGGRISAFQSETHGNLVGVAPAASDAATGSAMVGFGTGELDFRFNGGGPVAPTELEFEVDDGSAPGSTLLNSCACIWATSSSVQTFATEFIFYWEMIVMASSTVPIGTATETLSHADPGPAGTAGAIVASMISNNPGHEPHKGSWVSRARGMINAAWQGFSSAVTPNTVRSLVAGAMKAAGFVAGAYTGGLSIPASQLAARMIQPRQIASKPK